jgi:uncharacterized protein with von Willebrand factor type A (vWA) domain
MATSVRNRVRVPLALLLLALSLGLIFVDLTPSSSSIEPSPELSALVEAYQALKNESSQWVLMTQKTLATVSDGSSEAQLKRIEARLDELAAKQKANEAKQREFEARIESGFKKMQEEAEQSSTTRDLIDMISKLVGMLGVISALYLAWGDKLPWKGTTRARAGFAS